MSAMEISDKAHVLALDDQPENLQTLVALLSEEYAFHPFVAPAALFQYLRSGRPADLILLDILMPGLDGYAVCKMLREMPGMNDIPIVFLTGLVSREDEEKGLEFGASDYITKPFSPAIVRARVKIHSTMSRALRIVQDHNQLLDKRVAERTADLARKNNELINRNEEITKTPEATMLALSSLAEIRDNDTGQHIRRTQKFVMALSTALMNRGMFVDFLSQDTINNLFRSAALHDIGKVAIPDHILLKPGKLAPEEFEIMKNHAIMGSQAIENAEAILGSANSFLSMARDIAHFHHERWDGHGYPDGRSGNDIPLPARIMAVADVYDALTCRRVYKPGMPHDTATAIMRDGRGTHFDPVILDFFLEIQDEFAQIAIELSDERIIEKDPQP